VILFGSSCLIQYVQRNKAELYSYRVIVENVSLQKAIPCREEDPPAGNVENGGPLSKRGRLKRPMGELAIGKDRMRYVF